MSGPLTITFAKETGSTEMDHFIIDLCHHILGYSPPWRNDDVWMEEEYVLRSDIRTDDVEKSKAEICALMDIWGVKGKVKIESWED